MYAKIFLKGLLLILIFSLAFLAQYFGLIDFELLQQRLQEIGRHWWMPFLLIFIMVVFYAFALPGSLAMITGGVLYPPLPATGLAVLGGVLGAAAAFLLSRFLSDNWIRKIRRSTWYAMVKRHTGFVPMCLVRIFPGFPHSIINYSAGLLNKNLLWFLIATAIGFSIKGFVYTSATYNVTHPDASASFSTVGAVWPLLAIFLLILGGYFIKKMWVNGSRQKDTS